MSEIDAVELARMREEGDTFVAGFEKMHKICGYAEYRLNAYHVVALIAERLTLRARVAKLEAALKVYAAFSEPQGRIARAALSERGETPVSEYERLSERRSRDVTREGAEEKR